MLNSRVKRSFPVFLKFTLILFFKNLIPLFFKNWIHLFFKNLRFLLIDVFAICLYKFMDCMDFKFLRILWECQFTLFFLFVYSWRMLKSYKYSLRLGCQLRRLVEFLLRMVKYFLRMDMYSLRIDMCSLRMDIFFKNLQSEI